MKDVELKHAEKIRRTIAINNGANELIQFIERYYIDNNTNIIEFQEPSFATPCKAERNLFSALNWIKSQCKAIHEDVNTIYGLPCVVDCLNDLGFIVKVTSRDAQGKVIHFSISV